MTIKFPKVFKSKNSGQIVKFTDYTVGIVLEPSRSSRLKGKTYSAFFNCTLNEIWEPYNPKVSLKEIYAEY